MEAAGAAWWPADWTGPRPSLDREALRTLETGPRNQSAFPQIADCTGVFDASTLYYWILLGTLWRPPYCSIRVRMDRSFLEFFPFLGFSFPSHSGPLY